MFRATSNLTNAQQILELLEAQGVNTNCPQPWSTYRSLVTELFGWAPDKADQVIGELDKACQGQVTPSEFIALHEDYQESRQVVHKDGFYAIASVMLQLEDTHLEALKMQEEVLELRKRILPENHPDIATAMGDLAASYGKLGWHGVALWMNGEVLEKRRRILPKDHLDIAVTMGNLAASYGDLGRHGKALKMEEEVLQMRRRILPEDHPDIAIAMGNLAVSYGKLGRHGEALKMHEEVLQLRRRIHPEDHPDIAMAMGNLAVSYGKLGRHGEALEMNEEVLELRRRILPEDHPDIAVTMGNLAVSYGKLGRHGEALKMEVEVLELRRRILPEDHRDIAVTMGNLAVSYGKLGAKPIVESAAKSSEVTTALFVANMFHKAAKEDGALVIVCHSGQDPDKHIAVPKNMHLYTYAEYGKVLFQSESDEAMTNFSNDLVEKNLSSQGRQQSVYIRHSSDVTPNYFVQFGKYGEIPAVFPDGIYEYRGGVLSSLYLHEADHESPKGRMDWIFEHAKQAGYKHIMVLGCKVPISDYGSKVAISEDAGSMRLASYDFASKELAKYKTAKDVEKEMEIRLNQTGNVLYAKDKGAAMQEETQKLFKGVQVLCTAMTKAMTQKNRTLFDYEAWVKILAQSGKFAEVAKSEEKVSINKGSVKINTQIIRSLIPSLANAAEESPSLAIAKNVLSALDGAYGGESKEENTRKAHLLFICEEIMGVSSVTVRLHHMEKSSKAVMGSTPCGSVAKSSFVLKTESTTLMFTSPKDIQDNASLLNEDDDAFLELVDKLAGYIPEAPEAPVAT